MNQFFYIGEVRMLIRQAYLDGQLAGYWAAMEASYGCAFCDGKSGEIFNYLEDHKADALADYDLSCADGPYRLETALDKISFSNGRDYPRLSCEKCD